MTCLFANDLLTIFSIDGAIEIIGDGYTIELPPNHPDNEKVRQWATCQSI